jgi:hypothetical protein
LPSAAIPASALQGPLGGLTKAAPRARKAVELLGETDPEFTAVGGEGMFNVGKGLVQKAGEGIVNPLEQLYQRILQQGGR